MAGLLARIGSYFGNPIVDQNYYRPAESRNLTDVSTFENWAAYFGNTSTGINVSEEGSMALAAVYACVRVLSESVASLPFGVYENRNGRISKATSHPVHTLLHDEPNSEMTSFTFRETKMAHTLLWGNSYAQIHRTGAGRPGEFELKKPNETSVIRYKGKIYYQLSGQSALVPAENMLHIPGLGFDGILGKSPIRMQAESIGVSLAAQKYGAKFFQNGAHLGGVISHPSKLGKEGIELLKETWKFKHGGLDNVGDTAVLWDGMSYQKIGMPPEEAQFIQTRKYGRSEIAGIYKVPLHMIQDLERATFSNIEHQDLSYVKHTLVPWLVRIEQEYNRKVFRDSEKGRYYTKFNLNGLLRGDSQARATYYKEMWGIGLLTHNDILELEDMNTYEGGDRRFIPGNNMTPLDLIDQIVLNKSSNQNTGTTPAEDTTIQESDAGE